MNVCMKFMGNCKIRLMEGASKLSEECPAVPVKLLL